MSLITNAVVTPTRMVAVWVEGLASAAWLVVALVSARLQGPDGVQAALASAPVQRSLFAVLRAFLPSLSLSRVVVKAYENTGTALVTRRADVVDVLSRDEDFEVVYGPRMRRLTDGDNFFLGMQPGWDYTRDVSAMRLAARRDDVERIVRPRASTLAGELVAAHPGRVDLPPDLTLQVPWDMTSTYFGVGGPSAEVMQGWTSTLFFYLFGDLGADPQVETSAMEAAAGLRAYLDEAIARRKAAPIDDDDVLNRCLALQAAGTPGMTDLGIRNNLLGLLIGAIPTISKASCLALDELLRRPDALRRAQEAARSGDAARVAQHVWEALRFNPHNPVIYRRATRDTVIARSTLRARTIKRGQMVFAANLSAMFDRRDIPAPGSFRIDRPWETYIHWGYGMHTCFGDAINQSVIPAILEPLLRTDGLRRAEGGAGRLDTGGTAFPQHLVVEFDS